MKRLLAFLALSSASLPAALAASAFDGVWIMLSRPGFYYNITVSNNAVTFVQLEHVSSWGNLVGVWQAASGTMTNNTAALVFDNSFATTQLTLSLDPNGNVGTVTIEACTAKQSNVVCEPAGTQLGIQKVF